MASSLSRTPSGAGNQRTWTYSGWFKLCTTDQNVFLLSAGAYGDSKSMQFLIANSGNFLQFQGFSSGGSADFNCETNAELRDTNAWYHIQVACDTTQATASDRAKIYINGELQTLRTSTYPSQNYDTGVNTTIAHEINDRPGATLEQPLYATHIHMTDGTTYAPTVFGETDSTSGIWKPKTNPSVTYGTNGFFLKFENSGNLDLDSSGNNLSFTTAGTITQNVDTPSNVFATWNPISTAVARSGGTFANGNTTITTVATKYNGCPATLGMSSGKYYFEVKWTVGGDVEAIIGIQSADRTSDTQELGHYATDYGYYSANGNIRSNDAYQGAFGNTYAVNDIIGCAVDLDNNKLYFSKNGTWQNSGDPTSGSTGTGAYSITDPDSTPTGFYFPAISGWSNGQNHTFQANFGQGYFGTTAVASAGTAPSEGGIFEYDCPSGYQALCTKGINSF